jgi:hypothetical protein
MLRRAGPAIHATHAAASSANPPTHGEMDLGTQVIKSPVPLCVKLGVGGLPKHAHCDVALV